MTAPVQDLKSIFKYDDQKVDDVVIAAANAVAAVDQSLAGTIAGAVNLQGVEAQLKALNENLARTAAALEMLVSLKVNKHKK